MGRAIGVFGVPGVGKSTLLTRHIARQPLDRHVGGSGVIKAVIAPASVRDMDAWAPERQQAARHEAIRRLQAACYDAPRCLLVDGHFTLRNRTSGAVGSIVTPEDRAFYDAYILLDAPTDFVLQLAQADARRRHGIDRQAVTEHLEAERTQALTTSHEASVPLLVIESTALSDRLDHLETLLQAVT